MRSPRILVCASGGLGHLMPMAPLALELSRQGAEVLTAVPECTADAATRMGLTVRPVAGGTPPDDDYLRGQQARSPFERPRYAVERRLRGGVAETPDLLRAIGEHRPDLVLRETVAFAGWLAAEIAGLPTAVLDWAPTPHRVQHLTLGHLLDQARAAVGLPVAAHVPLTGELHLLPGPADWFPPAVRGPRSVIVRPAPDVGLGLPVPTWLDQRDPGRQLCYVTLGTTFNGLPGGFATIFDAVADIDADFLAAVGPDAEASVGRALPPNVHLEAMVDQAAVMARSDLAIMQGGYASLMSAVQARLPLVVVPMAGADTAANARRVAASGNGVVVGEENRSAGAIADAVRTVLEGPRYRRRAAELADDLTALPDLAATARLVLAAARTAPELTAAPRASVR